jgi:hypothetical protein
MEGAMMSIVIKQAGNNAPALFRIVRSFSVKSGIGAYFFIFTMSPQRGAQKGCSHRLLRILPRMILPVMTTRKQALSSNRISISTTTVYGSCW